MVQLELVCQRQEWMARGLCRGSTDLMHDASRVDEAVAVCENCPVRRECFEYALSLGNLAAGAWAGVTLPQRKRLGEILRRERAEAVERAPRFPLERRPLKLSPPLAYPLDAA
jgi:hypothetical protein